MKKRPWGVHAIQDMIAPRHTSVNVDGKRWGRVVTQPYHGNNFVAAWWVLTGKAYAMVWPSHEELNVALDRGDYPKHD